MLPDKEPPRDTVVDDYKPKTDLGKALIDLRRAYVANGGPLLDEYAYDLELESRK